MIAKLCKVLGISKADFYAWDKRPESIRVRKNKTLLGKIKGNHEKSRNVYCSDKIINNENEGDVNHIER